MNPAARTKLRGMIMRHEGFRELPYNDSTGNLTIGYGHKLSARPISQIIGGVLLDEDIHWFVTQLDHKLKWFADLDEARQSVLIDMAYNMGLNGLLSFHEMLDCVESKNYTEAAEAMLNSEWAKQVGQRAIEDAHVMKTGEI